MGVRGLATFNGRDDVRGYSSINILEQINNFQRYNRNHKQKPVIIIDLRAICRQYVNKNKIDIIHGGRFNKFNLWAQEVLSALNSLEKKAEIIYFIKVSELETRTRKIKFSLRSCYEHYTQEVETLNAIDDGRDLTEYLEKFDSPLYYFRNLLHILKYFSKKKDEPGSLYYSTINYYLQEMAYVANKKNALAILANDSDLIIFKGIWKYWSATDLNFENMTTIEISKNAVRDKLSLTPNQMPLLGTLAGNHFMSYDMVEDYHKRIAPNGGKFFRIASDIRSLAATMYSSPPYFDNPDDERLIIDKVFHDEEQSREGVNILQNSLDMYFYYGMQHKHDNDIQDEIAKNPNITFFEILTKDKIIFMPKFCYLSNDCFESHYDLQRPILLRLMGVILKDTPSSRTFYVKQSHEGPFEPVKETPNYPPFELPPLLKLLYYPCHVSKALDELRLNLFCWMISSKLNPDIILKLPKSNVCSVIALFYLIEEKQITTEEADCILLALNYSEQIQEFHDLSDLRTYDGRNSRIPFIFSTIFEIVYDCFESVGLQKYCNLSTFDGIYFHYIRKMLKEKNENTRQLLDTFKQDNNHLRIYSEEFEIML